MTNYIEQMLDISDNQKEKIKLAMKNKEAVTIRIDNVGNDKIALTESQINKINTAFGKSKSVNITLSKAQLKYNNEHVEGGFLSMLMGMLAPLAARALPAIAKNLGIGALTGVASSLVGKLMGNGMYLKRNGRIVKIKGPYNGKGLVLKPQSSNELQTYADGLWIKKDNQIIDGSGVLHNILKDIPLLNILF